MQASAFQYSICHLRILQSLCIDGIARRPRRVEGSRRQEQVEDCPAGGFSSESNSGRFLGYGLARSVAGLLNVYCAREVSEQRKNQKNQKSCHFFDSFSRTIANKLLCRLG